MRKKIYSKIELNENPVYMEISHDHLTTVDFLSGKLYHYYDPEGGLNFSKLGEYELTEEDMDVDLSILSKQQFIEQFASSGFLFADNSFSEILNIKRGTNKVISADVLLKKLIKISNLLHGKVKVIKVPELGSVSFHMILAYIGLLSENKNTSLKWVNKSLEMHPNKNITAYKVYLETTLKGNCLELPSAGYIVDIENYMHPITDGIVDMHPDYNIKLNKHIVSQINYELDSVESENFTNWLAHKKKHLLK
jgi:hypothetical protein